MSRTPPVRTLIVDDEAPARRGVRLLLEADPDIAIVGDSMNGREALQAIRDLEPDLVFLDIQMPDLDGLAMLRHLDPATMPLIVFVTAYDRYALAAFAVHAVDYLLKPLSSARFHEAVARAKTILRQRRVGEFQERLARLLAERDSRHADAGTEHRRHSDPSMVTVRHGNRSIFVKLGDVDWIGAEGDYAALYVKGRRYLYRETMTAMEARMAADRFVRIHRSTIARIDFIAEVRPHASGRYEAVLKDGSTRRISTAGKQRLEAALGISL